MQLRPDPAESLHPKTKEGKVAVLVRAMWMGLKLSEAAGLAGIHVATVCRWQAQDPDLRRALREAKDEARRLRDLLKGRARPRVRWRRDCPVCQAKVVVRTAKGHVPFWRCGRWPWCSWASWRPRAPRNCRKCGGPTFWAHNRRSIGCDACGLRIKRA